MRNPNGYGSVIKMSGNRRKTFVARKTVGWNEKGHPVYKYVGYYNTREEAMIALAEYNKSPWSIDAKKITFSSLFQLWLEKKGDKLGLSNKKSLIAAYKHSHLLCDIKYIEIKAWHMQECIDNCNLSYSTQNNIKNLFYHLDRFALEIDVISKGYSQLTTTTPTPTATKKTFTDEEIKKLWDNKDMEWVDTVLIFLYTGFRLTELFELKTQNVDLEKQILKGGIKTKAGKDRIIPIHPAILEFIKKRYDPQNLFLLSQNGCKVNRNFYYPKWHKLMSSLNMKHTPHECRHTFRSVLDSAEANKRCIDILMGHQTRDIGERVYTHKTIEELRTTILKLK